MEAEAFSEHCFLAGENGRIGTIGESSDYWEAVS